MVTVALVQAGTDELVFMGGGEYDEAQGEGCFLVVVDHW